MSSYDFSNLANVEITGVDLTALSDEQLSVLWVQARYCQAMVDADLPVLREVVSPDMTFTHMSGRQQTREQYFADITHGRLNYYNIGIDSPMIAVSGDHATITFTSVLDANAYGARGVYHMHGTHAYERRDGKWIAVNR